MSPFNEKNFITPKYVDTWKQFVLYIQNWYGVRDTQALEIIFSAALWGYFLDGPPIWLLAGGTPEYATRFLVHLPRCLTMKAMSKEKFQDWLKESGQQALWVMPDLDLVFDHRPRFQVEFSRLLIGARHGSVAWFPDAPAWSGRVTFIAASYGPPPSMPQKLQNAWRPLNGAFLKLRWQPLPYESLVGFATKRVGFERQIEEECRRFVSQLFDLNFRRPQPAEIVHSLFEDFLPLAELVARLQPYDLERSATLAQDMMRIAQAHATLFGKLKTDYDDVDIARRIAIDMIPRSFVPTLSAIRLLHRFLPDKFCEDLGRPKSDVYRQFDFMLERGILRELRGKLHGRQLKFLGLQEKYREALNASTTTL